MKTKNAIVFTESVKLASGRLENYGDAKLSGIHLLKLIYKYACYSTTYAQLQRLDSMVSTLQLTDPLICVEKMANNNYTESEVIIPVVPVGGDNLAPTLSPLLFIVEGDANEFNFTYSSLLSGFSDDSGELASAFVIHTLPSTGNLTYNGIAVLTGVLLTDPSLLKYTRAGTSSYQEAAFTFSAYDNDSQVPLESNIATATADVKEVIIPNQPAIVGDRAQYAGNRSTTVFNVADFTTQTIAPYFDPENNDLDAIRIDEISTANTGVYYYYANPVTAGQIITSTELNSGAFYHIAPDANSVSTDSFNASVRDTGSMIWVN